MPDLWGKTVNLYSCEGSTAQDAFNNKTLLYPISICLPIGTSTSPASVVTDLDPDRLDPYTWRLIDENGLMNPDKAAQFDSLIPLWQQYGGVYANLGSNDDGALLLERSASYFPLMIDVTSYMGVDKGIILWDENTSVAAMLYNNNAYWYNTSSGSTSNITAAYYSPVWYSIPNTQAVLYAMVDTPIAYYNTSNSRIYNGFVNNYWNYNGRSLKYTFVDDWRNSLASSYAFLQGAVSDYTPILPPEPSADPYSDAGDSGVGDFPHGDFNYTNDVTPGADRFSLPSISVVDTGFVTLYNPTILELKSLSNYLWSNSFDLNTLKKLFNDPMDLFIGLSILPVQIPDGGLKEVGIGLIPTGVYMNTAANQFVKVECGVCQIPNFSGGYLDYSPYTKVEVYLPYIGFRTLNADEVSGKALQCTYMVDILSGACTCWLDVLTPLDESNPQINERLATYIFMGECAVSIPLASGDWTSLINGIIGAAAAVGAGFASGGAGGAIAGGVSAASSVAVNDSKINVERSGAITSAGGLLAPQEPFVIITTPRIHKPADTPYYTGYPAYFTATLSDMSGFTTVDVIRLSGVPATENELTEIETLLKGGVIL